MLEFWNHVIVVHATFTAPMFVAEGKHAEVIERFRAFETLIEEPLEPWSECTPNGCQIAVERLDVEAEVSLLRGLFLPGGLKRP